MYDHLFRTIPYHHPTKMDVLPKTMVKIIFAAKWFQVRPPTNSNDLFLPPGNNCYNDLRAALLVAH